MVRDADPYAVLEVPRTATPQQIKRAFFRLLSQYPPEQKPDEFQRLREAYDVLSNPVARREYDSFSAFGDEIRDLRERAEAFLAQDTPGRAVPLLRKAIVLGPQIGTLRHLLGRCHLATDEPARALEQLDRAVEIDPENHAYRMLRGRALAALGRGDEAAAVYRAVWDADRDDYEAPRALASLYHDLGRPGKAVAVLDEAIAADGKVDFQDFLCLYDKLHIHLVEGKHTRLRDDLVQIVRVAEAPPDRRFAAFMLAQTGEMLMHASAFDLAGEFLDAARRIDPDNDLVERLADAASGVSGVHASLKTFLASDSTHPVASELVRLAGGHYLDLIPDADYDRQMKEVLGVLDSVMDVSPDADEVKDTLRTVKRLHPDVYALRTDLFDEILRHRTPSKYRAPCPHCGKRVTAPKSDRTVGACPFCQKPIRATGTAYERAVANGGGGGWSFGRIVLVLFVLWVMALGC